MEQNKFERNEIGLIKGFNYKYTEDGLIDWFQLLKPEHLYILRGKEKEVEEKYGKPIKELDLKEIDKKYVAILLSGLRYLSLVRGYKSIKPIVNNTVFDSNYNITSSCTVTCNIEWIGNIETNMQPIEYGGVAGATLGNVEPFVQKYIETIAENRAFCRAVRGFLNISVVSKDEIGPEGELIPLKKIEHENPTNPSTILKKKLEEKGWKFEQMKKAILLKHKEKIKSDPEKWTKIEDISANDIWVILGIIADSEKI